MEFAEIIEELNYKGKTLDEVIDLLINSSNGIEKIYTYIEKYEDEREYIRNDIKNLQKKYDIELEKLNIEKNNVEKKIKQNINDFNAINNETTNYGPFLKETDSNKLLEIESKLNQIDKNEKLLNGSLSRKSIEKKDELLQEKTKLLNDKNDYQKLKVEIFNDYNSSKKQISKINDKKNLLIEELSKKKIELYNKQGLYRKKLKQYSDLFNRLKAKLLDKKNQLDNKYYDITSKYQSIVLSKDIDKIAKYSEVYTNIIDEINRFYKSNENNFKLLEIDSKLPEINTKFNSKEYNKKYSSELKDNLETTEFYVYDNKSTLNKNNQINENNITKIDKQGSDEQSFENNYLQQENKQLNNINPLLWYDKYKEDIIKNSSDLNEEQQIELINYIDNLKNEFISLFTSFRRINYNKEQIDEAIKNTIKLVEKKKQELVQNEKTR